MAVPRANVPMDVKPRLVARSVELGPGGGSHPAGRR